MKKNWLAIAVGVAVSAPGLVLAEGPTFYGKINLSVEHENNDPAPGAPENSDKWEVQNNASRLGVKGNMDLDVGGLTAFYKAEFAVQPDDGGQDDDQVIDQRNIYGGVRGHFGALQVGYFDSPLKAAQLNVDQFNDLQGDIKHILAGENRFSNHIMYRTPKLAGLMTLSASLAPNEDNSDFDNDGKNENGLADTKSVALVLEKAIFYGAISRDMDVEDDLAADTQTGFGTLNITRLVAGVQPGNLELGALYQQAKESQGRGEETSYVLSSAFTINRMKLKAQYGMTKADSNDEELSQYSLGADYKLAKTTKAYAYLSQREADMADTQARTIGVGMEHKF